MFLDILGILTHIINHINSSESEVWRLRFGVFVRVSSFAYFLDMSNTCNMIASILDIKGISSFALSSHMHSISG